MFLRVLLLFLLNFSFVFTLVDIKIQKSELQKGPNDSLFSLDTSLGTLIGYKKNVQNQTINVFYGVPYAEPPVNELRFRRSKLIERFPSDPYAALDFKPHCAQPRARKYHPDDKFAEDCLYMNIWTPDLDQSKDENGKCKKLWSVMLYVYGGKSSIFQMVPFANDKLESGLSFSGELFAAFHETLIITFNYRHDLFATLLLDGQLGANLQLFDQNLAIRWVKKHIGELCGNADHLTMFGHSRGAAGIGYQLLSDYSKNLIDNAILQSSVPFFQDSMPPTKNELAINSLLAIIEIGNCTNFDNLEIDQTDGLSERVRANYFDRQTAGYSLKREILLEKLSEIHHQFYKSKLVPSKSHLDEGDYIDQDLVKLVRFLSKRVDVSCLQRLPMQQFLNVKPAYTSDLWCYYVDFDFISFDVYRDYKLFNKLDLNPRLNLLIGNVVAENYRDSFWLLDKYYTDQFNPPVVPKAEITRIIANEMHFLTSDDHKIETEMGDFYTDESKWKLSDGYYDSYHNVLSDRAFNCPCYFFANFAAYTASTVSSYHITYEVTKHFGSTAFDYDLHDYSWMKATHGDELRYLFGEPFRFRSNFNDLDRSFSQKILRLWTEFAKNGQMPEQTSCKQWPVSNRTNPSPRFVEINNPFLREWKFEFEDRCNLFFRPLLSIYKR